MSGDTAELSSFDDFFEKNLDKRYGYDYNNQANEWP